MAESKIYATAEWKRVRQRALVRARRRCEKCGAAGRLEVHHKVPLTRGGHPYKLNNLKVLCRRCHFEAHRARTPGREAWHKLLQEHNNVKI